ncbi:hypothetical protein PF010_g22943 [Phytophthora fragariae]|uniref:Uncharacterized protein n=1 Tax=Phytophthora fragariae TaxID=53985 RepID=A0A6G0K747_9STRA|nr:hypothetical protein PF010_g22943 [Phytophthora fragariae]
MSGPHTAVPAVSTSRPARSPRAASHRGGTGGESYGSGGMSTSGESDGSGGMSRSGESQGWHQGRVVRQRRDVHEERDVHERRVGRQRRVAHEQRVTGSESQQR